MENHNINNNNDENFEKSLKLLTEWYLKQPHLPQRYAGNFLRSFLVGCKMSIERSKKKLDNYFYYRNLYSDILLPPDIIDPMTEEIFLMRSTVILPKRTPEGHVVHLVKYSGDTTFDPKLELQLNMMTMEVACLENSIPSGGVIILFDAVNLTFKNAIQQITIARYYHLIQSVSPHQSKKVVVVNATKYSEKGFSIYKSLSSAKLKERLHIIPAGQIEKLANFIPIEILPKEYGGEEESIEIIREKWFRKLQHYYRNWYTDRKNTMSDESKRPPNMKRNDDLVLGTEGSFKQLVID